MVPPLARPTKRTTFSGCSIWYILYYISLKACVSSYIHTYLSTHINNIFILFFTDVFQYLETVWFNDYKERFVRAWTDTNYNFGQYTTNRAESQHARFKMHLKGPNSSLHRLLMIVDEVVSSQERAINHLFEESLSVKMVYHYIPIFKDLLFSVSHAAIELLLNELKKRDKLRET